MPYAEPGLWHAHRSPTLPQPAVRTWPPRGHAGPFPAYPVWQDPRPAGGDLSVRRPGSVVAATVLAVVVGGLGSLGYFYASAAHAVDSTGGRAPFAIAAVLFVGLGLSLLYLCGGVTAWCGRGGKLLLA